MGNSVFTRLPVYEGGKVSKEVNFDCGSVLFDNAKDATVCMISETSKEAFAAYCKKLESSGAERVFYRENGDNLYAQYRIGDEYAYLHFTSYDKTVRLIVDGDKTFSEASKFGYEYEKKAGETTSLYMWGLEMDPDGVDFAYNGHTRLNCGHFMIVKTADNALFIIDGGDNAEMSDSTIEDLDAYLHKITDTPAGEKVRISCWFISHRHPDHCLGFSRFLRLRGESYDVERMMYNFNGEGDGRIDKVLERVKEQYPNAVYHKPHTGERMQFADTSLDIVYTFEDELLLVDDEPKIVSRDFNNTSTVLRFEFDGCVFLLLADVADRGAKVIVNMYPSEYLKADVMQVAHHGYNRIDDLYSRVLPDISLYPQSEGGALRALNGNAFFVHEIVVKYTTGGEENIHYAGSETVRIDVVDGKPLVTESRPVVGEIYSGWDW